MHKLSGFLRFTHVYASFTQVYAQFTHSLRMETNERLRKSCINYAIFYVYTGLCIVYAMFASSTKECLRMFTQLTTRLPMVYACLLKISSHALLSLHAAGQIQKQELQRLLLARGNWNEYTSSLSVHVDRTMILVHSEAVLNLQLVPGG